MKYFAFFFDGCNYIERCLILLKHICNPYSRSLPHITVRLFKETDERALETKERRIKSLNIIEPGTFNFDMSENDGIRFVVYLRCESMELEGVEYKPDYPTSRLHLTIYEGPDYEFANMLLNKLKKCRWHFAIKYQNRKGLTERTLGSKNTITPDFKKYYEEILGEDYNLFLDMIQKKNNQFVIDKVDSLISIINQYIVDERLDEISSEYSSEGVTNYCKIDLDNQQEQFGTDMNSYGFLKPVRDNIYITRPEYALDMARCGISYYAEKSALSFDYKISFADSAIGTGTLFSSLKFAIDEYNETSKKKTIAIKRAIGMDIDTKMANEAKARCEKRGLEVYLGDALNNSSLGKDCCNLMIINPPFNKHTDIPKDYKEIIRNNAKEATGINVSDNAGLFVYYVLIMHTWLMEGGIGVWLLPTYFMQTKYGQALKEYFLDKVDLLRVHVYDETHEQFDANVSTSIIVFQKCKPKDNNILFSFGKSSANPKLKLSISRANIHIADNWRHYFSKNIIQETNNGHKYIDQCVKTYTLGDFFEIRRGIATGANSFFVISREEAINIGIPDCALKPVLPKVKYIYNNIIQRNELDGFPLLEKQLVLIDCDLPEEIIKDRYPSFYSYLETAKIKDIKSGKAIIERTLVKSRTPWYKQEKRIPPKFLLSYMGRDSDTDGYNALRFFLNRSDAIALNNYIYLYPKGPLASALDNNPDGEEKVLSLLEKIGYELYLNSRVYAGGLRKIEPGDLRNLSMVDIDIEALKYLRSKP